MVLGTTIENQTLKDMNHKIMLTCSVRLPAAAADGPDPGRARRAGDAGQLHGARHRRRLHPAQVPALVQGPGRRARGQESFNQGRHAPLHEARTGQVR